MINDVSFRSSVNALVAKTVNYISQCEPSNTHTSFSVLLIPSMKMVIHNVHCVHMDLVSSPIRDRELNINNKHDISFDQILLYFPGG